jgi:hypothetical protein
MAAFISMAASNAPGAMVGSGIRLDRITVHLALGARVTREVPQVFGSLARRKGLRPRG